MSDPTNPNPQQPYYPPPQQPIIIQQQAGPLAKLGIGISATMLFIIAVPSILIVLCCCGFLVSMAANQDKDPTTIPTRRSMSVSATL